MALAAIFLHSPLPLSFYTKSMKNYGDAIYRIYHDLPTKYLLEYVRTFSLLWLVVALDIISAPREYWRRTSSLEKGLLVATVTFIGYYLFFVLQIMGFLQRFYYPTLPGLIFLAAGSFSRLWERLGKRFSRRGEVEIFDKWMSVNFLLVLLVFLSVGNFNQRKGFLQKVNRLSELPKIYHGCNDFGGLVWLGLKELVALPDDFVFATTEIGCPGVMAPKKTVVDMTGLNETFLAHHGFNFNYIYAKYCPDLIYLPHPDYKKMTESLTRNTHFTDKYEKIPTRLKAVLRVAIRKNSKYYTVMKKIFSSSEQRLLNSGIKFKLSRFCFSRADWLRRRK
jgi:hypothetical protein